MKNEHICTHELDDGTCTIYIGHDPDYCVMPTIIHQQNCIHYEPTGINENSQKDKKMKPTYIKCTLLDVKKSSKKDGNKTAIILKEINKDILHQILVDESVQRVIQRLKEQYDGDEREGVFLSRGMINVNINTKGESWDINQEDFNWYTFNRSDVINL